MFIDPKSPSDDMTAPVGRTPLFVSIDIETAAVTGERELKLRNKLLQSVDAPSNYKDPAKIESYKHDKVAEILSRSSLNPNLGTIACIGVAYLDPDGQNANYICFGAWGNDSHPLEEPSDKVAIDEFINWAVAMEEHHIIEWVSKAGRRFDFPFIKVRALAHGRQEILAILPAHRDYTTIDLEQPEYWPGVSRDWHPTLEDIADVLSIPMAPSVPGSQMPLLYNEGNYELIREHNMADCLAVLEIARKLGYIR